MTRERAEAIARAEAKRFGLSMTVYRFKAWPHGVYGVRATSKGFPFEAEKVETFEPSTPQAPAPSSPAVEAQGSLFE